MAPKEKTPIKRYSNYVIYGSVMFLLMGFINLADQLVWFLSARSQIIGYIFISLTCVSLLPIAWGLREITDIYFVDHITKAGQQTATWIFFYAGSILFDMLTFGFPLTAGFVGLALIFGRVIAYLKINKLFVKINRIFGLKIGSFFYILFAYFAVIISVLGALSSYANDVTFEIFLRFFDGSIESLLMVIVGVRLIIDITRIKKFVETSNIQPFSAKKAFLTRDRSETPVLQTTKTHFQSTYQIERLQEKTRARTARIEKMKSKAKAVKVDQTSKPDKLKKETKIVFTTCPNCQERTDRYIDHCMNCGEKLPELSKRKSGSQKETSSFSAKRILSPKKEKILQQVTIAAFLIAFVTYAFISGDFSLIIYAWVVIALFATYLIVNYIILFFVGRGFAVTTLLSDIAFMLIIIPILATILAYFTVLTLSKLTEAVFPFQIILWILSIAISILAISLIFRFKVKATDMNIREYIKYRLDFKARAEELQKENQRVEKKRADFDNLDRIEAHMAKQRQNNVMDYEEFDFKQRLKDLGSPLTNDDEED
ncbi:MAG: hypothetical protein ACTSO5_03125 [Candidatus Heimdallarchaeaceae archaeon]